ncbi:hypothetical protein HYS95_00200 [Candidatus Daviesbacteria bacterium]|nr:hypothetical protein [Candidatus Daviesbacteria bacterium]
MAHRQSHRNSDMMNRVALGTGLALASGMLITAAVLAVNKKARGSVRRGFSKALKGARSAFIEGGERFQTIQHRIGLGKSKSGKKSHRSRKTAKGIFASVGHRIGLSKRGRKSRGGMRGRGRKSMTRGAFQTVGHTIRMSQRGRGRRSRK